MQRAVLFDFGGVFFKTTDYTPRHKWDERLGLPHGSVEATVHGSASWNQAQRGEIEVNVYWRDVAQQLGLPLEVVTEQLATDFYSGDKLDAQLVATANNLRERGHTVALLSNDCADLLRPRLEQLGITDLFDPLVISSELGVMKPNADAYQRTLEQLGRPAEEVIFIDDRAENIEGAEAVGLHGVLYHDGLDLMPILETLLTVSH